FLWSGTTGIDECARHRVDRVACRSAWQTPGWRTSTAESWSENNDGAGDPPASAVEVGSQQTPFVVTTSQISARRNSINALERPRLRASSAEGFVQCSGRKCVSGPNLI